MIARLRAFAYPQTTERCELCGAALGDRHEHVAREGKLQCACGPCAILFEHRGRVRPKVERVDPQTISDETWAQLGIPIQLAYFVRTRDRVAAFYPSVAGAVEAPAEELDLDLDADVEALLVDRRRSPACWRVSIDHCHRLTGLLRKGGDVQRVLDDFFAELDHA